MQRRKGVTPEAHGKLGFEPDAAQLQSSQQASWWAAQTETSLPTPRAAVPVDCGSCPTWKAAGWVLGTDHPQLISIPPEVVGGPDAVRQVAGEWGDILLFVACALLPEVY